MQRYGGGLIMMRAEGEQSLRIQQWFLAEHGEDDVV